MTYRPHITFLDPFRVTLHGILYYDVTKHQTTMNKCSYWYGRNSQLRISHPTFFEFELYQSMLYIWIKNMFSLFTKAKKTDKIQTIMKWRNDGYGQNHIPQPFQPWHKILTYHKNKRRMGQKAHLKRLLENRLTHMIIKIMIKRRKNSLFTLWELGGSSFEQTWIPFTFGSFAQSWNWSNGSWEEDFFLISSKYFRYFVIITHWNIAGPFIWTNLSILHPRMHFAKFCWNWSSDSWEEDFLNFAIA